jgi:serine/threonine-protein kinase
MNLEVHFEGFRIEEVLSRSSTTTVYRAWQESLERPVLIKELRPELVEEKDLRERFEREAQACARLEHENIVSIYQISKEKAPVFLVMEFVEGCSLADFIRDHPNPPLETIYSVILQTLRGLSFAHLREVIHRDLKPGNILISNEGWVKITDFGLAKVEGAPQVTRSGAIVGTPAYLSPEAIKGGKVTTRSDIFSLGVTFYQLITGNKIFDAEHFSDSLNKVLSYHPPKPSQVRSDVPPELDRIILRMLQKQPEKRWASCDDIINALQEIEDVARIGSPKDVLKRFLSSPQDSDKGVVGDDQLTRRLPLKKRTLTAAVIAIVVFALLIAGLTFFHPWSKPRTVTRKAAAPDSLMLQTQSQDTSSAQKTATETLPDSISPSINEGSEQEESSPGITENAGKSPPEKTTSQPAEKETTEIPLIENKATEGLTSIEKEKSAEQPLADLQLPAGPSFIRVRCNPWADVFIDGVQYGKTPLGRIELESGKHRLVFRHPQFPPVVRDIETSPDQETVVDVNFWETVGRLVVLAVPWAEVYVDGEYKDTTPLKEPIVLPLGSHEIELKNPALPEWKKEITFSQGEPPCTLRVDLSKVEG